MEEIGEMSAESELKVKDYLVSIGAGILVLLVIAVVVDATTGTSFIISDSLSDVLASSGGNTTAYEQVTVIESAANTAKSAFSIISLVIYVGAFVAVLLILLALLPRIVRGLGM